MKESANITLADINRLIEENERLKAALQKIADGTNCEWGPYCRDLARDALEEK